jgi:hypothetical protein
MARAVRAFSAAALLALGLTYYLTYEPAPEIGIAWRLGIETSERRALERRYGLANRRLVQGRMQYDVLDPTLENLGELLNDANVIDTDGIDRRTSALPVDYRYGEGWIWAGHRLPPLRQPWAVPALVTVLILSLAGAQWVEQKSAAGSPRPRGEDERSISKRK